MELIQQQLEATATFYKNPPCVARYRPIFWEPIPGTSERVVALIALEPHETTETVVTAGTFCILPKERLKALLGSQRGGASEGLLREVARYLSTSQAAGMPLDGLEAPFHGFYLAPSMVCRGYDLEQMLNAAVRSVSAFGNPDLIIDDEAAVETPRSTLKTAEFIKNLKRHVAGDDANVKARFDRKFKPSSQLPDLTIDYAHSKWIVQVTSLPATDRQSHHALRESQSKLFEIDLLRKHMDGNGLSPVLLVNEDVLLHNPSERALDQANRMLERLLQIALSQQVELIQARTPEDGAALVRALV